jgi:hypothetical protein
VTRFRFVPPLPFLRRALLALALTALAAGCTVTFVETEGAGSRPPEDVNAVIQLFEPRGGEGSAYEVGSEISFVVRSRLEGYVTLTSLGPDGDVEVFARNLPVPARREVVLDGADQGVVFIVEPPDGWHRVRASFTPRRTDATRVTFRGRAGEEDWKAAIRIDIEPFEVRDVAETRFYVR